MLVLSVRACVCVRACVSVHEKERVHHVCGCVCVCIASEPEEGKKEPVVQVNILTTPDRDWRACVHTQLHEERESENESCKWTRIFASLTLSLSLSLVHAPPIGPDVNTLTYWWFCYRKDIDEEKTVLLLLIGKASLSLSLSLSPSHSLSESERILARGGKRCSEDATYGQKRDLTNRCSSSQLLH